MCRCSGVSAGVDLHPALLGAALSVSGSRAHVGDENGGVLICSPGAERRAHSSVSPHGKQSITPVSLVSGRTPCSRPGTERFYFRHMQPRLESPNPEDCPHPPRPPRCSSRGREGVSPRFCCSLGRCLDSGHLTARLAVSGTTELRIHSWAHGLPRGPHSYAWGLCRPRVPLRGS